MYTPSASSKGLLVYPKVNRGRYRNEQSAPRKKVDKVYGNKQQTHEESRIYSLEKRK
jgi:hypothetical protein